MVAPMPDDRQTNEAPVVTVTQITPPDARTAPPSARYSVPLADAAARLKLGRQTAYDTVLRGDLDGRQIDSRWFVTPESLEKLAVSRGL